MIVVVAVPLSNEALASCTISAPSLLVCVGAPFVLLSSVSIVAQAILRGFPERSQTWLYAASNVGSLSAVVSYMLVIEPHMDLDDQLQLWRIARRSRAGVPGGRRRGFLRRTQARCPNIEVRVGDARLLLTTGRHRAFYLLVAVAFASDGIPAHLLTVEAFRTYLEPLTPEGVLALHVSVVAVW